MGSPLEVGTLFWLEAIGPLDWFFCFMQRQREKVYGP